MRRIEFGIKQVLLRSILLTLVSLAAGLLFGCSSKESTAANADTCDDTSIVPECILNMADDELSAIEDDFVWTTASIELAIAYDALGDSDRAWQLVGQAMEKIEGLESDTHRKTMYGEIALGLKAMQPGSEYSPVRNRLHASIRQIEDLDKRSDLLGKLIASEAAHGQLEKALNATLAMPETGELQQAYKARTLREVSVEMAKQGEFDRAVDTLNYLTISLLYYRSVARSDVAKLAIAAGRDDLVASLLNEAEALGKSEKNGYFVAGSLRDLACAYVLLGDRERAANLIADARVGARASDEPNERARSMSRIATKLTDCEMKDQVPDIISEAVAMAGDIESETMRNYSYYEIAGSAAFSGEFEVAEAIIKDLSNTSFGSATSLRGATIRDLAWGLARGGQHSQALSVAMGIEQPRERIHALSRLARVIAKPDMNALPRYL